MKNRTRKLLSVITPEERKQFDESYQRLESPEIKRIHPKAMLVMLISLGRVKLTLNEIEQIFG